MADRRVRVLFPWLIAAWPVLHLFASNIQEAEAVDVVVPLMATLGCAAVLYALLRLLRIGSVRAGLLVSLLVVLTFSFTAVHQALISLNDQVGIAMLAAYGISVRHGVALGVLLFIFGVGAYLILRSRGSLNRPTGLLNWISAALVLLALFRVGSGILAMNGPPAGPNALEVHGVTTMPDIYYIIPDRYPARDTLRHAYGFDNRPFLQALETRDFIIAGKSRSNYAKSALSIAAALDMDFHPAVCSERDVTSRLRRGHRVGEFLKRIGYRYLHLGSWYGPTSENDLADASIQYPGALSEFSCALLGMTPLKSFLGLGLLYEDHAEIGEFQLDRMLALKSAEEPRFMVVHLLLPHGPFVFDQKGRRIPKNSEFGPGSKERFLDQMRYLNGRLLAVVDHLVEISADEPIIVIQADEGPYLREDDIEAPIDAQRRIRTGLLTAFKGPGLMASDVPETITPVNTFRLVLSRWFGQDLPLLPDRVYSWDGLLKPFEEDEGPFHFEDVATTLGSW